MDSVHPRMYLAVLELSAYFLTVVLFISVHITLNSTITETDAIQSDMLAHP